MKVKIVLVPPKELYNYKFKLNEQPNVSKWLGEQLVHNGFAECIDHTWVNDLEFLNDEEE